MKKIYFRADAGATIGYGHGSVSPIVAVTQGATMIEKHFIIDREIGGPDASFSMNEEEFTQMVKDVRMAEASLGGVSYELTDKMRAGREFCRSLYGRRYESRGRYYGGKCPFCQTGVRFASEIFERVFR